MEDIVTINNENLANYIMFKLDKIENGFTNEELNKITEVVIDYNIETDSSFIFLEELRKLKNLNSITLRNGYIYNDNFSIFLCLKELKDFVFVNCEFENADLIASLNLTSLSLINCNINNYDFIYTFNSIKNLVIINGKVKIKGINMLNDLKFLQLSYSTIIDNDSLNVKKIEELLVDNTNIHNFNFCNNLVNLKRISIDEKQYSNNKDLFNSLIKMNIIVSNENMVLFGGENDAL